MMKAACHQSCFAVVLLALGVIAEAQQPMETPTDGIYRRPTSY